MAGLTTKKVVKKTKKHGVKAGQKSKIRPSQKKSVKNGRHQEKETPKVKNVKKAVAAVSPTLEGRIDDAELEPFGDLPELDEVIENDEFDASEEYDEDGDLVDCDTTEYEDDKL